MTLQEATYFVLNQFRAAFSESEASQMADWMIEHITGSKKTERMLYKNAALTAAEETQVKTYTERVMKQEPIQYVLHESWFCGLKFYVDGHVLIPRPETEELVEWIISNCKFPVDELSIFDIGSGSGCIPVSLKRRIRKAQVWSCDISAGALNVARKNAVSLGTEINFIEMDFLNPAAWQQLPSFDIIVSNPPYIPQKEKTSMAPNILEHEPAAALFVPDNDALVFYKAIAGFGKTHLLPGGAIYCEIHEDLGEATAAVFKNAGYATELKKDMQQKDRMLRSGLG